MSDPAEPPEGTPEDPAVLAVVGERSIRRLRHFTTDRGALGILATRELRSRDLLTQDQYLEFIYLPNCETRRDRDWTGHVNLSISEINGYFFAICSGSASWHSGMDGYWVIVELDPVVLSHPGVVFVTTNNMYTGAHRRAGAEGLQSLFADRVWPWASAPPHERDALTPEHWTTDPQAEALYPAKLETKWVVRLIVAEEEQADSLRGQLRVFGSGNEHIEVVVDPAAFQPRSG